MMIVIIVATMITLQDRLPAADCKGMIVMHLDFSVAFLFSPGIH